VEGLEWRLPLSVQIYARQVAAIVSKDYSIRIQHRDQIEDIQRSQQMSDRMRGDNEINEATHHKGGRCLTRMDSSRHDNAFAIARGVGCPSSFAFPFTRPSSSSS
jgi:hypothetical protein